MVPALWQRAPDGRMLTMKAVVNKCRSFEDADKWDRRQQLAMTPQERIRVSRELQRRVYGAAKDIRECHRND